MSARSFIDTTVLVYTDDHDARKKQSIALDLVERERGRGTGVVSTQVLQEYFAAVTRKLGVPPEVVRRKVEIFSHLNLMLLQLEDILGAIDLLRIHQISFWDALIVRAARQARCSILCTEDLDHGVRLDGLEIVNPFR